MLAGLDAVIVDGPKAGGLFVVRLGRPISARPSALRDLRR
jgi:hypothetical protein